MKIAVLGSAASVMRAPFQNDQYHAWAQGKARDITRAHDEIDGEFDIWGCSPGCWGVAPRATRWFEVHRWELNVPWFSPEYRQFLRTFKGPVYTGGRIPEIPSHLVYPIDEIEAEFSSYFLHSSLSLMMAKAIDEIEAYRELRKVHKAGGQWSAHPAMARIDVLNVGELEKDDSDDIIGMWGVDMGANEEYAYQRPGCQFFVLEAGRRGIGTYLPPESDLMRPMPVYGISEWDHNYIKLTSRARELNARLTQSQAEQAQAAQTAAALQGELHALNYFVNTWTSPYGMQHGIVNRQTPGTGLGGGITSVDTRPIARMRLDQPQDQVMAAMTEPPEALDYQVLKAVLAEQAGKDCMAEAPIDTARRIGYMADAAREHSALLQQYANPGESTTDTLRRIAAAAVSKSKKAAPKRRR